MVLRSIVILLSLLTCAVADPILVSDVRVKDSDSIYYKDVEYRMVRYDTPEIQTRRRAAGWVGWQPADANRRSRTAATQRVDRPRSLQA